VRKKVRFALLSALVMGGVTLAVWGFWIEPGRLVVRRYVLHPPDWPVRLDGLRVALLADLHVGSPRNGPDHTLEVVERTNTAKPDLILLAGDFVIHGVLGGTFVSPEEIGPLFAKFEAPLGVFAVLGNHDWWLSAPRVRRALEECGIPVLDDRGIQLEHHEASFWLVGVSDFWEGAHDIEGALATVTDDAPVLLFTHNPDLFPQIPARVTLTLAGHTHGGQVYVPLLGRPAVPSKFWQRYAMGHIVEDARHLFVTSGIGTSGLPVRVGTPPEVSILQLHTLHTR